MRLTLVWRKRRHASWHIMILALALSNWATAQTIIDVRDAATLLEAASQANAIDTPVLLRFSPSGTYPLMQQLNFTGPDISLLGQGSAVSCMGGRTAMAFISSNASAAIRLSGLSFTGCTDTAVRISIAMPASSAAQSEAAASVSIQACTFAGNTGSQAGGLLMDAGSVALSMRNCRFLSNSITTDPAAAAVAGAAAASLTAHAALITVGGRSFLDIYNCTVAGNGAAPLNGSSPVSPSYTSGAVTVACLSDRHASSAGSGGGTDCTLNLTAASFTGNAGAASTLLLLADSTSVAFSARLQGTWLLNSGYLGGAVRVQNLTSVVFAPGSKLMNNTAAKPPSTAKWVSWK